MHKESENQRRLSIETQGQLVEDMLQRKWEGVQNITDYFNILSTDSIQNK